MGYACPVCGDPQADAEHLANHLAFTAMLGDDDHEAWLDEHAPGWEREGEAELADRVAGAADEVAFPQVFEDTTGGDRADHGEDHGRAHDHGSDPGVPREPPPPEGAETDRVLEEARELTREMLDGASGEDEADDGDG